MRHSRWGLLILHPHAFLANSLMFAGGVLFAWLEGFSAQAGSGRLILPPLLFVLLWFMVQELLVQQAKYRWNDSRDHERVAGQLWQSIIDFLWGNNYRSGSGQRS
jgi:hypothetical protein